MNAIAERVIGTLERSRKLITPPEKWCIERIEYRGAYCALGALSAVRGTQMHAYRSDVCYETMDVIALDAAIPAGKRHVPYTYTGVNGTGKYTMSPNGPTQRVASYNNRSTHEEVLAWFDRAIALQKEHPMEKV